MATERPFAGAADTELVARAADGNEEAFAELYTRYHGLVYRFARMMAGDNEAAEEVTQDAFLALMRDLRRYDARRAQLSTYMYGIARNLVRNHLRRELRFVSLDQATEPAAPDDPARALSRSEDVAALRRALGRLPSRYREVVILAHLHGLPYAEIAAITRSPLGTVRSRLNRGRQMLSQSLTAPLRSVV